MRFFNEPFKPELPRDPLTGIIRGAILGIMLGVYYDLSHTPSPENSQALMQIYIGCTLLGFTVGAAINCYDEYPRRQPQ